MTVYRYTAQLFCNGSVVLSRFGNDLQHLIIKMMTLLDTENVSFFGEILDNQTGEIVHRCRKAAIE